ncbi:related to histone H3 methyltransferase DIM-5 [Phialocephala subalpina]|uniref:Related to histone H3 methyltransferase DIM-5 n=1 Tax=Phialocephala subalpina TaxID=576137 RepID=A0A1L7XAF7_9HELO|nr:related to histone H3 methyltransferase DIM-5 [Phialocephala subalpina]
MPVKLSYQFYASAAHNCSMKRRDIRGQEKRGRYHVNTRSTLVPFSFFQLDFLRSEVEHSLTDWPAMSRHQHRVDKMGPQKRKRSESDSISDSAKSTMSGTRSSKPSLPSKAQPQAPPKPSPKEAKIDDDIAKFALQFALLSGHDGKAKAGSTEMRTAHFACHGQGLKKYLEEEKRCHYCQFRSFSTHTQYPISIVNNVDNEGLPETFKFVDRVVPSANIILTPDDFYIGCNCTIDLCTTGHCLCQEDVDISGLGHKVNAYHGSGVKNGRLRTHYINGNFPIYECGPSCRCPATCPNRVVQQGRKVKLQIFKTDDGRGWGVRSLDPIKKGQFVDTYVGELLTPLEAQARRDQAESSQAKDVYMFALDKFSNDDDADDRLHGDPYEIDGEFMSGPTRFINHSCVPNLRNFAVVKNVADRPFHGLAFFALDDIPPNTELTFDYLDGVTSGTAEENKTKKKCLCGAGKQCRGYLF